jgi:TPR repeat protein
MRKALLILLLFHLAVVAQPADEWAAFEKTKLFESQDPMWLKPDMEKETVAAFTSRLLDGARRGDARSMATLGRFFFVRGDVARAAEWLGKAAEAGHSGAQLDYGTLRFRGQGVERDLVDSYKWVWLATWAGAPGADAALAELSPQLQTWQLLAGMRAAVDYQESHRKSAKAARR